MSSHLSELVSSSVPSYHGNGRDSGSINVLVASLCLVQFLYLSNVNWRLGGGEDSLGLQLMQDTEPPLLPPWSILSPWPECLLSKLMRDIIIFVLSGSPWTSYQFVPWLVLSAHFFPGSFHPWLVESCFLEWHWTCLKTMRRTGYVHFSSYPILYWPVRVGKTAYIIIFKGSSI